MEVYIIWAVAGYLGLCIAYITPGISSAHLI